MPIKCCEWRTIPQSSFSLLWQLLALLAWPVRWPFALMESRRENQAFASGIDPAWSYCELVWGRLYAEAWCHLIHTSSRPYPPRSTILLSRFAREFSCNREFLVAKARSTDPILAAYAVMCCSDPNVLPHDILQRTETLVLRDWFYEAEMPFGTWVQQHIESFNQFKELDDEFESA